MCFIKKQKMSWLALQNRSLIEKHPKKAKWLIYYNALIQFNNQN